MLVSLFTPTYNRSYTLDRLYESLVNQTDKNFEWIVVDDGSTDDTQEKVMAWEKDGLIKVRYFYQRNSGKPSAHNRGVEEAQGSLFCCVDSDDYLRCDAVEKIIATWEKRNSNHIGILAFRVHIDGTPITQIGDSVSQSTLRGAYKYHGLKGDTMLVFDTSVIKKYAFPIIEGEKFIPEGYLYNKLDREGMLIIFREGLYICEYQPDGYTANVDRLLFNNYKSYIFHVNTRSREVDIFIEQYFDSIRYTAIAFAHLRGQIISNAENKGMAFLALLPGYLLYRRRYMPLMKEKAVQNVYEGT